MNAPPGLNSPNNNNMSALSDGSQGGGMTNGGFSGGAAVNGNFKGKRSGGSRNTPLTGNTQNPRSPAVLTPTKNM